MSDAKEKQNRSQTQQRREAVVRSILSRTNGKLSQDVVQQLRSDLGVSRATAYRIIKTFRTCGALTSPLTRPVGRPKGARVLDPAREKLIGETIETFFLQPSRPKFSALVQEIGRRCEERSLPPPNWRTIRARVRDVDMESRTRRPPDAE